MTRPLHQRYQREFWPAMAAYVAIMLLLWPLLPRCHSEPLRIALALLPVLPVLFVVRAMVRLVLGSDELEQRIHLIGLAIASTAVGTLSMAGGFLAAAGVVRLDGSILVWVWPALVAGYGVGRSWASRRYGDSMLACNDAPARHWRLIGAALVLAGVIWCGREQWSDAQWGLLCGLAATLALVGAVLALLHWHRTRRGA